MYPGSPSSSPATLLDGVLARLRAAPTSEALRDESGLQSRGELSAASGRLAFAMLRHGVRRGDRLLLALPPGRSFAVVLIASMRLGAVVVPVHRKTKLRELSHVLWDAGPRVVVAEEGLADLARSASAAVRVLDPDALLADPLEDAGVELSHEHAGVVADAADPALILYTSGTTGKPKGAVHTQGSLAANVDAIARTWRLDDGDRLLHCLPLHHLHGLVVGLLASLQAGVAVEFMPEFDAGAVVERLAASRATLFYGVPSMYAAIVEQAARTPRTPLPALRLFVSGSAPLAPALKREFERRFGFVILERYGSTETGIVLSQDVDAPRPAGFVGRPLPGFEVRLDPEGEEGELLVRGPSLFRGYHEDEEATARSLDHGWYRTGDLVRRSPDGTFRILGRLSTDILKVHGHRVGVLEIESALAEHPGVAEAVVVGLPDPDRGQTPVAFIRPRDPTLTAETLLTHARSLLAPYQVPTRIEFVDSIPKTGPGKPDRAALTRSLSEPT